MELNKRNIEDYIDRFMEGETTNAEEQAIYRFFRTGDVPPHLMGYAPMFAWYEEGMQENSEPCPTDRSGQAKKRRPGLHSLHIPIAALSASIAAMIVVCMGLGLLFYSDSENPVLVDEQACYEGSYIEVGGKRITDIEQIFPLILEEQAAAERKEKLAEQRIREMEKKEKQVKEKELMVN